MDEDYGMGYVIPQIELPQTTQPAVTKDGTKFATVANSIANLFTTAAPIVQSVTNKNVPGSTVPMYSLPGSPGTQAPAPTAAAQKGSNLVKYGVIAAVVLATGVIAYKLVKKKKGKGLGDITATTKSGKNAQRKAIFARLSEGSKPKKRNKSRKAKTVMI